MPQSNYQQHSCLLSLENGRWTMNGLRAMIGNEPATAGALQIVAQIGFYEAVFVSRCSPRQIIVCCAEFFGR
jgi:hypothetical protein